MSAGERIVRLWVEAYIVDRSAQQIEISFGKCARAPNTAIVGGVCGRKSSCRDASKLKPLPPQTDKPQGHSLESPLKSKFHAHNKPACIANQGATSLKASPAIPCSLPGVAQPSLLIALLLRNSTKSGLTCPRVSKPLPIGLYRHQPKATVVLKGA